MAAVLCSTAVWAQTDTASVNKVQQLEQVVVTGLSNPQKLKNALSTYQVITKEVMNAQGAVTVSDALRNQLNVNIGTDPILGSNTSMQGLKGDKVKILIDGMPVNGREGGEIDLGQINLNNVAKIEIVQGPMSVVYGSDALGGVINIITARAKTAWGVQAGTYYETIGKYNFDASGNCRINKKHQISLGGGRNFFDGWKPLDPMERAFLWWPKEQYLANAAYDYTANSSFRLRFATDFVREKLSNKDSDYHLTPFYAYGLDRYYYNSRVNSRLQMSGKLGNYGSWQMQNGYALYYRVKNLYRKDLVTLDENLVPGKESNDTTRFDDVNMRGNYTYNRSRVNLTAGYDMNLEYAKSGKIPDSIASNIQDYAAYGSAEISFLDKKLKLQPALRYAYNTAYQAPLIPSFHILYSPNDDVQIRASYAKGFRAPSMKELYLLFVDNNHQIEGNPNLLPETGHHIQASASWRLYEQQQNFFKLMATGFYNNVKDQIVLVQPDTLRQTYGVYSNLSQFKNIIGTLQAEGQWQNLYAQAGVTASRLLIGGLTNLQSSYQATLMLQYSLTKTGLMLSTFYKYLSRQPNVGITIDGSSAYNGIIAPYSFWDASVEKGFWKKHIMLTAGIKNILNVQNVSLTGATSGGAHGGGSGTSSSIAAGRTGFASLRINF